MFLAVTTLLTANSKSRLKRTQNRTLPHQQSRQKSVSAPWDFSAMAEPPHFRLLPRFEPPLDFPAMAPPHILLLQLSKGLRLQDMLTS